MVIFEKLLFEKIWLLLAKNKENSTIYLIFIHSFLTGITLHLHLDLINFMSVLSSTLS